MEKLLRFMIKPLFFFKKSTSSNTMLCFQMRTENLPKVNKSFKLMIQGFFKNFFSDLFPPMLMFLNLVCFCLSHAATMLPPRHAAT